MLFQNANNKSWSYGGSLWNVSFGIKLWIQESPRFPGICWTIRLNLLHKRREQPRVFLESIEFSKFPVQTNSKWKANGYAQKNSTKSHCGLALPWHGYSFATICNVSPVFTKLNLHLMNQRSPRQNGFSSYAWLWVGQTYGLIRMSRSSLHVYYYDMVTKSYMQQANTFSP